jgi:steroid delta-isomerase-like uncharacterized protein
MSTEKNKAVIRRWMDLWNTGNLDAVDEFVAADYVRHDPNGPEIHGPEAERQLIAMYLAAFPDLRFTIEHLIAEGDLVLAHSTARGTHRGELLGVPPTDRTIAIAVMDLFQLADGKIVEQWVAIDTLGMLQQIGAVPGAQ